MTEWGSLTLEYHDDGRVTVAHAGDWIAISTDLLERADPRRLSRDGDVITFHVDPEPLRYRVVGRTGTEHGDFGGCVVFPATTYAERIYDGEGPVTR